MNFSHIDAGHITVSEYINNSVRFDTPILYIIRSADTAKTDWSVSFVYYQHKPLHCDSDAKFGRAMHCTIAQGIKSDDILPYKGILARRVELMKEENAATGITPQFFVFSHTHGWVGESSIFYFSKLIFKNPHK